MALGKIKADTLEHSTAGSLDTQYVVNGSAKAWCNFNGTGTLAVNDSFSISSVTDNTTATYTPNISSAFSNSSYSMVACLGHTNKSDGWGILEDTNTARTTTATKVVAYNGDFTVNSMLWNGDLA